MSTFKGGAVAKVGDIFSTYPEDNPWSDDPNNQWKIIELCSASNTYGYQNVKTQVTWRNQNLGEVQLFFLRKPAVRQKTGFGKFIERTNHV